MLKKFRKVTVLALALAMIFAMSANVFAVDAWSHIWYASDDVTTVEYYATIDTTRTLGSIDSLDNQGEVRVDADIYIWNNEGRRTYTHLYDNGIYFASIYKRCEGIAGEVRMADAEYSFYAYVGSTGEEFPSGTITLTPTP